MASKVLIVAFDFPPQWGGVATYGYELATGLQRQGCEVRVLTGESQETPHSDIKIQRVRLAKTGIASIPLLTWHLIKMLRQENFDAIFCPLWLPDATATFLAQKILGLSIPYFVTVHAMEIVESNTTLKKRLRQKLTPLKQAVFLHAKKVFCVSQHSKKLLHSSVLLPQDQAVVINNGANPQHFYPAPRANQNFRLFSACRLVPNKGVDQMLKVLPELLKDHPSLQYRVAGDGPDLQRLHKLNEMLGTQDHVQFLGKIDSEKLLDEYQQADLFIMLSRKEKQHQEGFGLVFLEAALCATPSLGGDSGGIPDAIENNVTGWLVDPYSENAILQKLKTILSDTQALQAMGQQARNKTLANKTWDHRIQQILQAAELC